MLKDQGHLMKERKLKKIKKLYNQYNMESMVHNLFPNNDSERIMGENTD